MIRKTDFQLHDPLGPTPQGPHPHGINDTEPILLSPPIKTYESVRRDENNISIEVICRIKFKVEQRSELNRKLGL